MTAALERGDWSAARPCRNLLPEKIRYPLYRRLGWPQGRSGQAEKISASSWFYYKNKNHYHQSAERQPLTEWQSSRFLFERCLILVSKRQTSNIFS